MDTTKKGIMRFDFNGREISTIIDVDRNPWFFSHEVCEVLEIVNSRDAVSGLDDDEKKTVVIADFQSSGRGGDNGKRMIINEPGLYSLILRSRKEEAKRFKKWVTSEVLPTIRKTGGYQFDERQLLSDPARLRAAILAFNEELEEARPKAAGFNRIADVGNALKSLDDDG